MVVRSFRMPVAVLLLVSVYAVVFFPEYTYAALVPCNGTECEACHVVQLLRNVIDFLLWSVAAPLSIILLIYTGFMMFMNPGAEARKLLKGRIQNIFVGFLLALGAWVIVDTALKLIFDMGKIGPWNTIQCVGVSEPQAAAQPTTPTVTSGTQTSEQPKVTEGNALDTKSITEKYGTMIKKACESNPMGQDNCASIMTALIAKESGGKTDIKSERGALGIAQILESNGGKNCNSSDTTCIQDQITKGVTILTNNYTAKGDNTVLALAMYNGGNAAVKQSSCCSSGYAYECAWNCGGASTAHQYACDKEPKPSVCTANTGFTETRNYVSVICATMRNISGGQTTCQ